MEANMAEVEVGKVTHFFNKANVAGIKLSGQLSVGDTIHILGHTTDLTETVDSMQVEHESVQSAGSEAEIGLKVDEHVREHDTVYLVK